jgi:excisionase family DNA binding protein
MSAMKERTGSAKDVEHYTTIEAAEVLEVTDARVRQMILNGEIEAEKRGRDLFIPHSEVERAKGRKTKPGPAPQRKPPRRPRRKGGGVK